MSTGGHTRIRTPLGSLISIAPAALGRLAAAGPS